MVQQANPGPACVCVNCCNCCQPGICNLDCGNAADSSCWPVRLWQCCKCCMCMFGTTALGDMMPYVLTQ